MISDTKKSWLKTFILSATTALLLAGCGADPTSGAVVSDSPTVTITYLMQNFESMEVVPPVAPHQNMEGSAGYFYIFDDPDSTADSMTPSKEDGQSITDGYTESTDFIFYGNTTSVRLRGTAAGAGVGIGGYFQDGEELIPAVIDTGTTEEPAFNPTCDMHPVLGVPCAEAVKKKIPRPFTEHGQEGLVFWAKGTGTITVVLSMPDVVAEKLGGTCVEATEKCFDYHAVKVSVDGQWKEYSISWDKFKQAGWGKASAFSPDEFTSVQFTVAPNKGSSSVEFDIWLDMIGFYGGTPWDFMAQYGLDPTDTTPNFPLVDTDTGTGDAPVDTATASESEVDTASDSGTDTSSDTTADSATDSAVDSATDSTVDSATDSVTDTNT